MDTPDARTSPVSVAICDEAAFTAVVKEFEVRIGRYLCRMIGNVEDARDLTQEVFLRAYRRWGDLRSCSSPASWLFAIASNLAKDHYRRRRLLTFFSFWKVAEKDFASLQANDPYQAAGEREVIARCMAQLPREAVECLLLYEVEGLSSGEVAAVLAIRPDAARQRIARARRRFRKVYRSLSEG